MAKITHLNMEKAQNELRSNSSQQLKSRGTDDNHDATLTTSVLSHTNAYIGASAASPHTSSRIRTPKMPPALFVSTEKSQRHSVADARGERSEPHSSDKRSEPHSLIGASREQSLSQCIKIGQETTKTLLGLSYLFLCVYVPYLIRRTRSK